jgi:hypothetical protein
MLLLLGIIILMVSDGVSESAKLCDLRLLCSASDCLDMFDISCFSFWWL